MAFIGREKLGVFEVFIHQSLDLLVWNIKRSHFVLNMAQFVIDYFHHSVLLVLVELIDRVKGLIKVSLHRVLLVCLDYVALNVLGDGPLPESDILPDLVIHNELEKIPFLDVSIL